MTRIRSTPLNTSGVVEGLVKETTTMTGTYPTHNFNSTGLYHSQSPSTSTNTVNGYRNSVLFSGLGFNLTNINNTTNYNSYPVVNNPIVRQYWPGDFTNTNPAGTVEAPENSVLIEFVESNSGAPTTVQLYIRFYSFNWALL